MGKARVLVALRTISRGETVILEPPVIHIGPEQMNLSRDQEIYQQYVELSNQDKVFVKSLISKRKKQDDKDIVAIFDKHCITVGMSNYGSGGHAIYKEYLDVTHSCCANCVVNIGNSASLQLVATRKILKGEEITVNRLGPYINRDGVYFHREQRRLALQKSWNLTCSCEVCSLTGQGLANNEEIKRTIVAYIRKQHQQEQDDMREEQNLKNIFSLEVAILDLMRKIEREMLREMPDCLVRCFKFGKLLQLQGTQLRKDPKMYIESGRKLATSLGPTYLQEFRMLEQEVDTVLGAALARLVEERKRSRREVYFLPPGYYWVRQEDEEGGYLTREKYQMLE